MVDTDLFIDPCSLTSDICSFGAGVFGQSVCSLRSRIIARLGRGS